MTGDSPLSVTSEPDALRWRRGERAAGRRVAFTNGCFDILHAGHVNLLTEARMTADALIVGLNDDRSVARLKGASRPLVPELERAELLAALEPVDRVVLFGEDTPLRIIEVLEPDVLVKGADWAEDRIIGAREVLGWGGNVVRVSLSEGSSTSELLKRVRERFGSKS